jgi:hypothetical protein
MKNTNDPKAKYYKNYLIMGKFFFKIQEIVWWFVAELEDQLYPYKDREVDKPLWAENYDGDIDELGYLKHQMEAQNQRVERLQEEMLHVLRRLGEINTLSDNKNDQIFERQKSSETNHQTS